MTDRPHAPAAGARQIAAPVDSSAGAAPARTAPARPTLVNPNSAPVLVKLTPPFSVRLSLFLWILSFALGAFAIIYFFVIRETQLPLIVDAVRGVTEGRSDETYDTAADIVFWGVFGGYVAILLTQITLLVSFMSRRPQIRWWLFGTVILQGALTVLARELVTQGDQGGQLAWMWIAQTGLAALALLISVLPKAMAWSARRHDVRRSEIVVSGGDF